MMTVLTAIATTATSTRALPRPLLPGASRNPLSNRRKAAPAKPSTTPIRRAHVMFFSRSRKCPVRMVRQDGEHRTEGRDRRSVDRRGIGSSPQQHEHPAIDDQHGHDQDIAEIAQRNAVGPFREKGERNEKNRRRKYLKHKNLLEIEVVARQRDIKRKIGAEQQIGENQIEIITQRSHRRKA